MDKISKDLEEKSEKLAENGTTTPYITKGRILSHRSIDTLKLNFDSTHLTEVRKVMKLATTYTDLKNTGRIDAYLSKKRKRLASKKKKEMPTRRVANDDD